LALFVVSSLFAQGVKIGVKAGVNMAGMSDVEVSVMGHSMTVLKNDGMSIGYHGGVFANISFSDFIGFQPELLFSMQGGKYKLNGLSSGIIDIDVGDILNIESVKINCQFGYINLPLLLEIKPVANLGILVGPQVGYNVIRKATATVGGIKETISGSDFDNDFFELNKIDVGAAFGLQYMITEQLQIGARYYHGLTDGFKSEEGLLNLKVLKNRVFQISMGYVF
jgi:hypothetical protein